MEEPKQGVSQNDPANGSGPVSQPVDGNAQNSAGTTPDVVKAELNKMGPSPSGNGQDQPGSAPGAAPTTAKSPKNSKKMLMILVIILVLAALGAVGYMLYKNHNNKNSSTTPLARTSNTNTTTNPPSPAPVSPTSASTTTVVKFTELGVEVTVPNSIKDVVYKAQPASTTAGHATKSVTISTKTLSAYPKTNTSDCSDTGSAPPLGTLYKVTGQYPKKATVDNSVGALVKQFTGYYISWTSPQSACSGVVSIQKQAITDTNLFSHALFKSGAVQVTQ